MPTSTPGPRQRDIHRPKDRGGQMGACRAGLFGSILRSISTRPVVSGFWIRYVITRHGFRFCLLHKLGSCKRCNFIRQRMVFRRLHDGKLGLRRYRQHILQTFLNRISGQQAEGKNLLFMHLKKQVGLFFLLLLQQSQRFCLFYLYLSDRLDGLA